ncbi:hypothetical protein Q5P01_018576 [Channa striata]|uniref:Uncharacterized protein n=1 Tax=Channa striata TaxID=64152 RepID=A0AA88S8J4_CHASR|nr:hypothetical protein Q5P01_018576 [Channa striata]
MVRTTTAGQGGICSSVDAIVVKQCSLSHRAQASSSWTLQSCQHPRVTGCPLAHKEPSYTEASDLLTDICCSCSSLTKCRKFRARR